MDRQQAHQLLDQLGPAQFTAVAQLLEVMAAVEVEPLARSIAMAPAEDEEITDEMATALDHARSSIASGEGIPHSEILREFGLNP